MSTPSDVQTRVAATYNAAADRYEDPVNSYWNRFGRRTVERLNLPSGSRVLDVCCGAGASALVAAERVGPAGLVVGVDLADALLQRARARADARGLTHIDFRIGDLLDPPLDPAAVFDAVVCVFGVFFVPDMTAAVRRLWSQVAPGGVLAITSWGEHTFEPGDSSFWQAIAAVRPDLHRAFIPWDRLDTADGVRTLFASSGLPGPEIGVEQGEHPLARAEDWWTVVLGSGSRGTVDQLTSEQQDRVREASTAYLRASGARALTTNVIYATLQRPPGWIRTISRETAAHYSWGAACDGWHLVRTDSLSVIEERMPAGTAEVRHRHRHARQFFYVLEGALTIESDERLHHLPTGSGIEVAPGMVHEVRNDSSGDVRFIVVSQPPSHGDREIVPRRDAGHDD